MANPKTRNFTGNPSEAADRPPAANRSLVGATMAVMAIAGLLIQPTAAAAQTAAPAEPTPVIVVDADDLELDPATAEEMSEARGGFYIAILKTTGQFVIRYCATKRACTGLAKSIGNGVVGYYVATNLSKAEAWLRAQFGGR